MADPYGVAAGFALFSGLALGALGAWLVAARPRRTHATAFGLFLLLWGLHIVLGNLARLSALDGDVVATERWVLLSLPPLLCLYIPLAYFAATYPPRRGPLGSSAWATAALLGPAAAGALALAAMPGLLYGGLTGAGAATRSVWGPLHPLYVVLLMGGFYYAIAGLEARRAAAAGAQEARRARLVAAALVLYVAYWSAEGALVYGAALLGGPATGSPPWQEAVFLALALAGLALTARVGPRIALAPGPDGARPPRAYGLAVALPLMFGLASGASAASQALPFALESLGVWRTLAAGAIAYAIVRADLFELELGPLVAELSRTRGELAAERRFAERLVERSADGIFAFDGGQKVTLWNPGMERLSGVGKRDALGQPVAEVLPGLRDAGEQRLLAEALRGRKAASEPRRQRLATKGPEGVFESHYSPLHGEGGGIAGGLAIVHDVTERARAEEERRKRLERQRELERLRELDRLKTQFINTVAHELNTPLTALQLNVDLLTSARNPGLGERQQRAVTILERNLERMSGVVREMLDAARLQSGRLAVNPEPLDLRDVLRDAAESLAEAARRAEVSLAVEAPQPLPVQGDPRRLAQVALNVVSNALKFTPAGGRVSVEARREGGEAVVRVRDTGAGMRAEDIPKLFRPFSQVHDTMQQSLPGAGLGLYISKGLVEEHGGRIWAESAGPGKGSVFGFALPLRAAREPAGRPRMPSAG